MDALDVQIIRVLQQELPLVPAPYQAIADALGIPEDVVLQRIQQMQASGALRRLGAILNHRKAGYASNAMVVWSVPQEQVTAVGMHLASKAFVSHCYERPTFTDWPYNVYAMVHARTREECDGNIRLLASELKIAQYAILYSVREFKKTGMRYFEA